MTSFSQAGQDIFVRHVHGSNPPGTYCDIGCQLPKIINNTLALELEGWRGVSIDIENWSEQWNRERPGSRFVCADALKCVYNDVLQDAGLTSPLSYISIDVEGMGSRYQVLKRVMDSGIEAEIITIETDTYRGTGYGESEREPQRALLNSLGYLLVCTGVCASDGSEFEDWWINPKYVPEENYADLICSNTRWPEIVERMRT